MDSYLKTAGMIRYQHYPQMYDNVGYVSPKKNKTGPIYLLISNWGPFFSIKDWEKYGEIREYYVDKNSKFAIFAYTNPEVAEKVAQSLDHGRTKIKIISEDEKNNILKNANEDLNFIDKSEHKNVEGLVDNHEKRSFVFSNDNYSYVETPKKTYFQKFVEVFFNL